jgi:ATP-dependent DNA helicase RecG
MIGFANADGGRIVIGISGGKIEGITSRPKQLNEFLQAGLDYTEPPVRFTPASLECVNEADQSDQILILDVVASENIHHNRRGECFLRVGDENRHLQPDEERELAFDKGRVSFDNSIIPDLRVEDLDQNALRAYQEKVKASTLEHLLSSRRLYSTLPHRPGVTHAGLLLFGHEPPIYSYIRYIRYLGKTIETGTRSNVQEDIRLEGTLPALIESAHKLLREKIGSVSRLTSTGRFEAVPLLPEFAWLEAVVNAVTHRSYNLHGDGIRIRDFEDRLEVESPGRLPGLVRVDNIQSVRFSRNPHIARVLAEFTGHVREMNEGVARMFEEMEQYNLPKPKFVVREGSVCVTLYKRTASSDEPHYLTKALQKLPEHTLLQALLEPEQMENLLIHLKNNKTVRSSQVAKMLSVSKMTAIKYMKALERMGLVSLAAQSRTDPTNHWAITVHPFWQSLP